MNGRTRAIAIVVAVHLVGCGAASPAGAPATSAHGHEPLPDLRRAKDRPPVVLVVREGDPSGAIAVAVTTSRAALPEDDPEIAVALAGVVEARLAARGVVAVVAPSWSGFRAAILVATSSEAEGATTALREALTAPIDDKDLAVAKKKLAALAARPLPDAALAAWARCVGSPHALPSHAGKSGDDLDEAALEKWRAAAHGFGRVAIAVAAPSAVAESVASTVARLPAWKVGVLPAIAAISNDLDIDVYEVASKLPSVSAVPVVHATLDVSTASDAVTTAEALGDPQGPLASRLASLDLPFRLREITGAAEPGGGCVGLVLEATGGASTSATPEDLANGVANAMALVHLEAHVHLAESGTALDGRVLAGRAGHAREAAERAAWWALADSGSALPLPAKTRGPAVSVPAKTRGPAVSVPAKTRGPDVSIPAKTRGPAVSVPAKTRGPDVRAASSLAPAMRGSVALGLPLRRSEGALEPSRDTLSTAMQRAALAWQKPAVDGRARVEPGQGETWVLLASTCGTDGETDADAGLTALFTATAAEMAKRSPDARVEPWIAPDGAGLLVHGPAQMGETSAGHARRLADVVARSFASDALAHAALGRARAELLRHDSLSDGPALALVASAVAPGHPSWFIATGREDTLERAADAAVFARAQSLRAGPLRIAVLANVDAAQGEAAFRAADRWVDRRVSDPRSCGGSSSAAPPRPGTYAIDPRAGAAPEAYLAFPLAGADEGERAAATLIAAALDGYGGLLEKALQAPGLARSWSARVVGWPRAPAIVVRIVSTQTELDAAVMQARALVDRVKNNGLTALDHERATGLVAREAVEAALDPRARVVATWRGDAVATSAEPLPRGRTSLEAIRSFAAKRLGEEALVVVASRPGLARLPSTPPSAAAPRAKSP